MIKINYKEPESTESLDDIAEYNIKISNQYKKTDYLEISCISWLKIDSKRDYQDLEKLFRHIQVDAWVIAQPITNIPNGLELNYPNDNNSSETLNYVAKISCKSNTDAINELLVYHSSYEENFNCLKKTGCFMTIKQKLNEFEEDKLTNMKSVIEIKKVLDCKLKLDFTYFKSIESINFIIEDLINKYGKKPEEIACGEINGNKVYGLVLEGQIASPIGWVKKNIKKSNLTELEIDSEELSKLEQIEYELIDFRNIKIQKE